jgi:penicillin-binding protein 1A
MSVAVANRPVEQFETQVPIPDWQLTPEEEVFGDQAIDANSMQPMVDENGMPLDTPPQEPGYPQQQPMVRPDGTGDPSQQELDQAFPPPAQRQPPPQRLPQPQPSTPPPDPSQPRPDAP